MNHLDKTILEEKPPEFSDENPNKEKAPLHEHEEKPPTPANKPT